MKERIDNLHKINILFLSVNLQETKSENKSKEKLEKLVSIWNSSSITLIV